MGCLFVADRVNGSSWSKWAPTSACIRAGDAGSGWTTTSAANSTTIYTYGLLALSLNFGLRQDFTWRFVMADVTRQTSNTYLDRTTLSPTPSLTSSPSLRPHHTTHWPHRKTATTSSKHSWAVAVGSSHILYVCTSLFAMQLHIPLAYKIVFWMYNQYTVNIISFLQPSVHDCNSFNPAVYLTDPFLGGKYLSS
jgi:hypothetical protein